MIPHHLNFKYLKQSVSIEAVLSDKGLMGRFAKHGNRLVGPCPIHNGDNPHAFVVTLSKNIWHCFTGCNTGGDIVDFVRFMDKISYPQTAQYLATISNIAQNTTSSSTCASIVSNNQTFRPFTMRLNLDPYTPYLKKKKIDPDTAMRFDVGAYHGKGFLENCIGVRLHDINGRPLGYAGRRLIYDHEQKYGKWKLPFQFPKNKTLYNFHRIQSNFNHGLVIVECPWGVMRLAQLNIPAVALLGINLAPSLHHLFRNVPQVILMLDGDQAGRQATNKIYESLKSFTQVHFVYLPQNMDPDDFDNDTLSSILKYFL